MNHIESFDKLNNRYFGMRHGEAQSNIQNIIVGDPDKGLTDFGLTDRGRETVRESLRSLSPAGEYIIVSSDFLRAKETAEIAKEFLRSEILLYDERLRERFFGDYENGSVDYYDTNWQNDKKDPEKSWNNVEPANHQMERVTAVISDLENKYIGKSILLVSHGDPLQFLETAFAKMPISEHQNCPLFDLGEIKELKLN